jgi:hypothetical protein
MPRDLEADQGVERRWVLQRGWRIHRAQIDTIELEFGMPIGACTQRRIQLRKCPMEAGRA